MAASAQVNITGSIDGLPGGGPVTIGPIAITSAAANGQEQWVVLQAGDNMITVPASPAPSGCVIVLPSGNTSIVTLKGTGGGADVGIALGKTTKQVLNWDATAAPASFILNSVATQTGLATRIVFF